MKHKRRAGSQSGGQIARWAPTSLLEEHVQTVERLLASLPITPLRIARPEVLAAIRAFALGHPFGARLPAFVVRGGIVKQAVMAGVQIRAAALAIVVKTDPISRAERNFVVARSAAHTHKLRQLTPLSSAPVAVPLPCIASASLAPSIAEMARG